MLTGRKLPLTLAFAVLVAAAFGAGCKGFFQKRPQFDCDPAAKPVGSKWVNRRAYRLGERTVTELKIADQERCCLDN